jgi:hypothetical protein
VIILIITKLIGGLGNQMFQYAIARRLTYLYNQILKLDITGFQEYKLREYCLNHLNIAESIATDEEINYLRNIRYIKEKYYHLNPEVLELSGDVYLEGNWQSEKYFKDIGEILQYEFSVKQQLTGENLELANRINSCDAVSVHFRRGDYVTNPVTYQYHGLCQMEYYHQAMRQIVNQLPNAHFFIFSDEPCWVKQHLRFDLPFTVVDINDNEDSCEDLRLISFCKYHIIANSTFSWWGAWLSQSSGKIVYAPQRWFNNPGLNTCDLIPEGWRLI